MNVRIVVGAALLLVTTSAAAGPRLEVTQVRVLDERFSVVRVITDRRELDAFAAAVAGADEVKSRAGHGWTHPLDIAAPHGGRWVYDARSGELQVVSKGKTPVYRLTAAAKRELDSLLAPALPPEVVALRDRIETCTHFAGEEPYDDARRAEILAALEKAGCFSLEADEQQLRARYADQPAILDAFDRAREFTTGPPAGADSAAPLVTPRRPASSDGR